MGYVTGFYAVADIDYSDLRVDGEDNSFHHGYVRVDEPKICCQGNDAGFFQCL